jgi:hypothetical protein
MCRKTLLIVHHVGTVVGLDERIIANVLIEDVFVNTNRLPDTDLERIFRPSSLYWMKKVELAGSML